HTGVALAVLETLVARGEVRPEHTTVVISTANGLKFPEFKVRYHEGTLEGISSRHANRPIELPADYEVVKRAALEALGG
ncbi:MAG: threonine synthase, partial [Chloroflexi bacterium]|nr:threonine synthase [Chloroflexota bacterium]